ncbi:tRNA A-37 threonylcarbamoyl transferase component Bud32 [Dysgonomonas sp. PH5-45]|uniref:lipopolysaccharide kinase InaA family protein n=1 Tax=unclassified Dysgonomonas TaxID=2630389 RepID=UPI0024756942|nr:MULTISPECIES: lipopolysaccharide kinase InaA family protein [unclassified Dysgonomonas]MDH6355954.1 tRNA A-37 threonylcarbamoyl transferase component Bud32 [Dysgonomonas sp. PH5-45]MDH6388845.1 tRNA A-37 threonylcarbamoyl transferase component Bud32 [Dysgonomonas sp. PH5-37]
MQKEVVHPLYKKMESFIKQIPSSFNTLGEVDYKSRNIIRVVENEGLKLNIKSFKIPHFINRLVYKNFRETKAKRSYHYALKLKEYGFHTPQPIAYIEESDCFLLGHSYYVCIHENFDGSMREFRSGKTAGREELLRQFGRFAGQLHNRGILHLDFSAGNVLYKRNDRGYDFYLVDLNRMKFDTDINMAKGCYSMRKLFGNDEMLSLIAEEYANTRGFDSQECVGCLLQYHNKFWTSYQKRHPHNFIPAYTGL